MTWSDVFERERYDLTRWAAYLAGESNADDVVQEAIIRCLERPVPDDPRPWLYGMVRSIARESKRARAREMALVQKAGPVLTAEGDDVLVSMDRCRPLNGGQGSQRGSIKRNYGEGRGSTLARVACEVCGTMYKPHLTNKGQRKATCGSPKCVARLRERRRREAA